MRLTAGEYLAGLAFLAAVAGSAAVAAWIVVERRLPRLAGVERFLAGALLFTAFLIGVHLVPAMLGVLGRPAVLATAALLMAGILMLVPRATAAAPEPAPPKARSSRLSFALAGGVAVVVAVVELAYVYHWLAVYPGGVDALTFHLPGVASWMQTGSIWQIDQFVPGQAHGNYPNNGDVVLLAAVLPWSDDFLMRIVYVPWLALTGVSVYALARALRAPRPAAVLFGAVATALPTVLFDAVESTLPDVVMFSTFAAGLTFLVRHARTGRRADLVLAGVGLGIAFGTKWFGVSSVLVVCALWALLMLARRRSPGPVLRDAGVLGGMIAACGGVWLVRNLALSGNPVFPAKVAPFGITIFDAPRDVIREQVGFSISDYLGEPSIWTRYFLPAFEHGLGIAAALVPIVVAVSVALAWRSFRAGGAEAGRARIVLGMAGAFVLLAATYALTPYSAFGVEGTPALTRVNVRYAVPAVMVVLALGGFAAGRLRRASPLLELAAAAAIADGLRRTAILSAGAVVRVVALLALVAAVGYLALPARRAALAWRPAALHGRRRPLLAAGLGLLLAMVFAAGGYRDQHRLADGRYRNVDPAYDYVLDHAPSGRRIGLAGEWAPVTPPPGPMLGPRLANEVGYVGRWVDELLQKYDEGAAFAAALRRGRYDLVLVGRGAVPKPRVREEVWARAAGFRELVRSDRFTLLGRSSAP